MKTDHPGLGTLEKAAGTNNHKKIGGYRTPTDFDTPSDRPMAALQDHSWSNPGQNQYLQATMVEKRRKGNRWSEGRPLNKSDKIKASRLLYLMRRGMTAISDAKERISTLT
jgi:hypothetical protein